MKTNLPVILLKEIVLLPNNELRIEVENKDGESIIDLCELFHDNKILIVNQKDQLEEKPLLKDLPKLGVIAKIEHKMELPNGVSRVLLNGLVRAEIIEYVEQDDGSIESFVRPLKEYAVADNEIKVLVKKLNKEMDNYISKIPYASNSVLSKIENIKNLSILTDLIAPNLPIDYSRMQKYLFENSATTRTEMILEDIYGELEKFNIERVLDNKIRQELEKNQKEFILREKIKYIKEELGETSNKDDEIEKMREKLNILDINNKIKNKINDEIKRFEMLNQSSPEINITKSYIDWMLNLPWNKFTEDNDNLKEIKKIINDSHYGLDDIKTRILEYIAVNKMTNKFTGPIICLVGPPGVGKTSITSSIAKALNKNFVKMSVGGLQDESEIKGHRKTYLGANPGRIIQSMKKADSSNPLFLIDEIDKMTKEIKGDPASALLEILDPEQNKYYSDNFIEEEYDLSNVMFILTANYIEQIPHALRDRLEILELSSYTEIEKLNIAKNHLIPNIIETHGLKINHIIINDETILKIIREYTKEAGVRELKRQIEKIIRKIVTQIVTNNIKLNKIIIDINILEKYLGKPKIISNINKQLPIGVVNGLAYTTIGGDTLKIETINYAGNGELKLTGSLGDVMKESANIAYSYILSNSKKFGIDLNKIKNTNVHIHVPDGAVKKDGPSAGVTLTTALLSSFKKHRISNKIAMTGEISLTGQVLPIGGLKEKSIAAARDGITTIFIPKDNLNDLDKIPNEVKDKIKFIPVSEYIEIYNYIFIKNN